MALASSGSLKLDGKVAHGFTDTAWIFIQRCQSLRQRGEPLIARLSCLYFCNHCDSDVCRTSRDSATQKRVLRSQNSVCPVGENFCAIGANVGPPHERDFCAASTARRSSANAERGVFDANHHFGSTHNVLKTTQKRLTSAGIAVQRASSISNYVLDTTLRN